MSEKCGKNIFPRNRSDEKFVNRRNEILEILHYAKSK